MPRPISASPRFQLRHAFVVIVGVFVLEAVVAWTADRLYLAFLVGHGLNDLVFQAATVVLAKLVAAFLVAALVLRRAGESWRAVGRAGFAPLTLLAPVVAILASAPIFLSELDNLLRAALPAGVVEWLNFGPSAETLLTSSWLGPVLAVVIAPLVEELLFRGLILRGLLGRYAPRTAIVVSALLFALAHFNPVQAPVALGLGLFLGWAFVRTRSLGLCVVIHGLNNLSTYLVGEIPFAIRGFNAAPDAAFEGAVFHPWWFDATAVALLAAGLWLFRRLAPAAEPWPAPATPEPPRLAADAVAGCQPPLLADTSAAMSAALAAVVTSLAQRARAASLALATAPTAAKNAALEKLATLLDASHPALLAANALDLASPAAAALPPAARDRLTLTEPNLAALAASVRAVAALPDPVGELLTETVRPNGLRIRKVRVPIGVVAIIYESRPNVTIDCAALCLKSGNAAILRGGKECFHTNTALAALVAQALAATGLPVDAAQLVPTTDRAALTALLKLDTLIHCVIPRGGERLIRFVAQNSTIPVIKHYQGVCFVYVDAAADLAMAETILVDAKVSRPSACNSAEQLLVHRAVAETFLPPLARALVARGVELRCDAAGAALLARENIPHAAATAADFTTEFLAPILAVRIVDSLDAAIATINRDGSSHSDAIVTADEPAARRFLAEVDSATVFWNASTRFNDGFEFGFGAEIGISTDRLHARGPMGLPELCSYKYLIEGAGQVRA